MQWVQPHSFASVWVMGGAMGGGYGGCQGAMGGGQRPPKCIWGAGRGGGPYMGSHCNGFSPTPPPPSFQGGLQPVSPPPHHFRGGFTPPPPLPVILGSISEALHPISPPPHHFRGAQGGLHPPFYLGGVSERLSAPFSGWASTRFSPSPFVLPSLSSWGPSMKPPPPFLPLPLILKGASPPPSTPCHPVVHQRSPPPHFPPCPPITQGGSSPSILFGEGSQKGSQPHFSPLF